MRIAVLQMTSGIDPSRNADTLADAVREAAASGAAILFTPEMTGLLDRNRQRAADSITDQAHDPVLARACELARQHGIWIALGSLALSGMRADGRLVNRSLLIDPAGAVKAHYDKIHLFDVDLPSGESWRESAAYAPGERAVVADGPGGQGIGLSICYDVRFPALYQRLSEASATVLSVPAAFTVPTGQAHWHILLRARAIENACFVVAAAQCGMHEDGRATYGHSLVIGPWGDVKLDMGQECGVGFADLDWDEVDQARSRVPVIAHRKAVAPAGRLA